MKKAIVLLCLLIFTFFTPKAHSFSQTKEPDSSQINYKKLVPLLAAETAFFVGGISYLQYVWYKDMERVPFHFYNDNAGYKQIDKFGHAYGAYVESLIGYKGLRSCGVSKKNALIYGGSLGFFLQLPIEIFDGLYEGWGFSIGDVVANAAGSALLIGQEILFDEQIIQYKFSFRPSPYAAQAHGYLGNNFMESLWYDYNGHNYWFSINANKIIPSPHIPAWLNLALGYSAGGMFGEFENKRTHRGKEIPETQRYRQLLLSLDIDCSKIKTNNKLLKTLFNSAVLIKIPAPTLELNTLGKLRGHWIYF
jgi:hypothetical protein